jgi:CHAT domain-containing protein
MGRNVDPEQATPRMAREDFPLPSVEKDAVVVEYVAGRERLFAYVSTAGATHLVDLGERAPIESAARDFVSSIADGSASARNLGETSFSLYERIILPLLAGLPPDAKYWTLVPTADLATIPFEALVTSALPTEQRDVGFEDLHYLIDSKEIAYAPSSAVLAELEGRPARSGPRRFLVLGDPVYRTELESNASLASTGTPSRSWIDLDRLPATHDETREIAQLMILSDPKATDEERKRLLELAYRRSGTLTSRLFDLRLGSDAVASALPSDASSYTNLHFAVHGHVDARDSRHSGLVLSWEPATGGLLTLEELLTVRLDADLVVLSACDTASGPIVRGEGVQSLANAFVEAGARSVIASLWKVADQDAAEIMKAFYRSHLDRGEAPSVALRRAKLEYRKSHQLRGERPTRGPGAIAAHPCSWAAFVFVGAQAR